MEEVLGEAFGVGQEFGEVEFAGVVELLLGGSAKHFVYDGGVLAFEALLLFQNFGFGGFEDAVEAAEDGHREHDFAVLGRAVGATEEVGDVPDEAYEAVGVVGHAELFLSLSVVWTVRPRGPLRQARTLALCTFVQFVHVSQSAQCSERFIPGSFPE